MTLVELIPVGLRFLGAAFKVILKDDISSISTDGVYFGDILYDSCLSKFQLATIRRVNAGVILNLFILFGNYYRFKKALVKSQATALLVSHTVGLSSGVLAREPLCI